MLLYSSNSLDSSNKGTVTLSYKCHILWMNGTTNHKFIISSSERNKKVMVSNMRWKPNPSSLLTSRLSFYLSAKWHSFSKHSEHIKLSSTYPYLTQKEILNYHKWPIIVINEHLTTQINRRNIHRSRLHCFIRSFHCIAANN